MVESDKQTSFPCIFKLAKVLVTSTFLTSLLADNQFGKVCAISFSKNNGRFFNDSDRQQK